MAVDSSPDGRQVLVGAPSGTDRSNLADLLASDGYAVRLASDPGEVARQLDTRTGAVIITDEIMAGDLTALTAALSSQPEWSNIPFVLITAHRSQTRQDLDTLRTRLPAALKKLIVLEQPFGPASLLSTLDVACRSRQRQFEIRDRLQELADERARLNSLVENLPVGVCFIDLDGNTVLSNPKYDEYVPNRLIPSAQPDAAMRWLALDSEGRPLPSDQFAGARALRGEHVPALDCRYLPPDGGERWTRISAVPLYDSQHAVIGAAMVIIDIDAEKQNESMLRRFNDELEIEVKVRTQALEDALALLTVESQERARAEEQLRHSLKMDAVGQLTGGIAHDFNNMLTGIIGALELMRVRLRKQQYDDLGRYMDAAHSSAGRAAALTQRLLAFSRRQSLENRAVAINPLVESLSDLLQRTLTESVVLEMDLAEDAGFAMVDANQLENALLNLSINARDAMPEGGTLVIGTQRVERNAADAGRFGGKAGTYVSICVTDTGVGIPQSLLEKVFEPFFTTKPLGQGTGLGLSMVYGFVQQSNGFVTVDSHEGQGTTITLHLPLADIEIAENETPAAPSPRSAGAGQSILVVEDDDSVRLLLQTTLQDLGYSVHLAEDGQRALQLLDQLDYLDLLISDVGLPGLNGRQLAEIFQQKRPGLPVLFMTGYAENAAVRSKFLGPGMTMITKPFSLESLADAIAGALRVRLEEEV
ncbi:PAS/PAC sensor hybrid histidine kinase [Halopseudomonas xinjiangensis]|uniref:histidine kinase n=1 Tax=Halopseudomonas xinjiangensis TaxID=487184 RepID=A0A1H1T342_9GAMM|nr:response regulator [Halopseudomonas xinjiangensis]SDS54406.1 PAS/PAC sensor hybrid histidine kinase [Halopseudomonas xinjiangensis]